MLPQNPECPNNDPSLCRISITRTIKEPVLEWTPIYDGTHAIVNSDPNTFVTTGICETCSSEWMIEETPSAPNSESQVMMIRHPANKQSMEETVPDVEPVEPPMTETAPHVEPQVIAVEPPAEPPKKPPTTRYLEPRITPVKRPTQSARKRKKVKS